MQRRLSAWSSQNSQTFLNAAFFAQRGKNETSRCLEILAQHNNSRCHLRHRNKEKNSFVYRHIQLKSIFTNRNIRIYMKINTLKAIWSILLHGCECWTPTKDLERRLEAAEMWYIRRIMRISWTGKKSNEEVMEMAGYKRSLLKTIRKTQLQFFLYTDADFVTLSFTIDRNVHVILGG